MTPRKLKSPWFEDATALPSAVPPRPKVPIGQPSLPVAAVKPSLAKSPSAASLLLGLLASIQARARGVDAATVLATELAVLLVCDRVGVGLRRHQSIELIALSHQTLTRDKPALLRLIAAAMEEAAFQQALLCFPEAQGSRHILLAHGELARQQAAQCIVTVPLARDGKVYGAITCERGRAQPFHAKEVLFFEHVAALLGPVLELKCTADKPWWTLAAHSFRQRVQTWSSKSARVKAVAGACVLFAALIGFLPVQYRVSAPARLEGSIQRALAAPTDGFLKQVYVRPGDEVKEAQVLAELSDEEFVLERGRRQSELAQLESSLGDALAKHDTSQIGVFAARVQEATAQLELVTQQLQRTRIQAPFDGVILKGDLSQSVGAPVRQGDALFVLAPVQGHRVILEVDERDIAEVSLGKPGLLNLSAFPSQTLPFSVKRITPMTTTKDGRNYFEVEATLQDPSFGLRPGLQGVAKVDVERRALAWVLGHDLWNWSRLALWSLLG